MVEVIKHTVCIAKKEHYDDGYEYVENWMEGGCYVPGPKWDNPGHITFSEGRTLVKYRKDRALLKKIFPGQQYVSQFNKRDRIIYTFKMKKDLYDIACKYDLFPED